MIESGNAQVGCCIKEMLLDHSMVAVAARVVAWHVKVTKICPQLTRGSPGPCRFSECAG